MGKHSPEIEINPEILLWALKNSGWDKKDIIKKLKISEETINSWLKGSKNPTMRQIKGFSNLLKRQMESY